MKEFEQHLRALGREDSTIRNRMYQIEKLSERVPLFGATPDDLERILAQRRHLAKNTRHGMIASWRVFYRWAHATGRIPVDPAAQLVQVKVKTRVPRLAPDDAVLHALQRASGRDAALIGLARLACLRLTEVTTLHTRDRVGDRLIIRGKGDKERVVYINEELEAILNCRERELRDSRGYYFPGRGVRPHMHPQSVNKIITRLTGCNPHSLRHAGATAAYRATKNLRAVQEMLGHESLATTERYRHLEDEERRRAAAGTRLRTGPRNRYV